ncbi:extracellular solute-binding protein [Paenibacillus sp. 1P07SE]|uniref:extracellular solute-binding protein n=1 Tax=Paenibacillus sp. 1P07SE TaxID=3132209 RepID=UPI0039A7226C
MNKSGWSKLLLPLLTASLIATACSNSGNTPSTREGEEPTNSEQAEVKKDISVSIYDRGSVAQDEGTIENNRWTKWINEHGPANVKYVAIPRASPEEKINVLYASGSAPDILFEFNPKVRDPLYQQKQLMPIDELIEEHSIYYKQLLEDNPGLRKAGTKPDGQLYEFGKINWVNPNRGLLIRNDWLEKLSLDVPQTMDDLLAVATAFANDDPDGNGSKDTYGFTVGGQAFGTARQMFGALWALEGDQLVRKPERRAAFYTLLKQMYDNGVIDRDFPSDENGARAKQDFINGKIGIYPFLDGNAVNILQSLIDPLKANVPEADVTFIPYPETSYGGFTPTLINPVQMTAVISASAKNPDAAIKYIDFMASPETDRFLLNGLEGTHHSIVNGCPEITDAEKLKKEVSDLTLDMRMLQSSGLTFSKCDLPIIKYQSDPRKEEFQSFYNLYRDTYFNFDREYVDLTHSEHMPTPPRDLNTIESNTEKTMDDIWLKAVVSGASYSIEQAIQETENAWSKAGGQQVEDWYREWYAAEKDSAFLAKDIYKVVQEQMVSYEEIMKEVQ